MKIQNNISLKPYNTFGIHENAKRFVGINTAEQLKELLLVEKDIFLLGGGSNLLITKPIEKLVLYLNSKGIIVNELDEDYVLVSAEAGENWHDFVQWTVSQNYGGLENLSLIPGNVGTSPIQNIGAYGVEIKDTFHFLEAVEIETRNTKIFYKEECNFGYRNSIFKTTLKGKFVITSVTFKLTKRNHSLNISYGAIKEHLKSIDKPSLRDISEAVIAIRQSKLPDPNEIGNSGSFFKNPVVNKTIFEIIKQEYPTAPHYVISEDEIKIPAGWLIEQCGFKGKRYGDAGVHSKQALVLVNFGNATGMDILNLAKKIQLKVNNTFGISLEVEVNII